MYTCVCVCVCVYVCVSLSLSHARLHMHLFHDWLPQFLKALTAQLQRAKEALVFDREQVPEDYFRHLRSFRPPLPKDTTLEFHVKSGRLVARCLRICPVSSVPTQGKPVYVRACVSVSVSVSVCACLSLSLCLDLSPHVRTPSPPLCFLSFNGAARQSNCARQSSHFCLAGPCADTCSSTKTCG